MRTAPHWYRLIVLATATLAACAQAETYYVDANYGDDHNAGTANLAPWKTIQKVNQTVRTGDTVYLARGSVWTETLTAQSGVSYNAYGTTSPAKPLIRGSRDLGSLNWKAVNGKIYAADVQGLVDGSFGQLYLNGTRLQRARHPNVGQGNYGKGSRYLRIATDTPGTTDTLTGQANAWPTGADLLGAEVYSRNNNYAQQHYLVAGANGRTLQLMQISADWPYPLTPGWGYWLENKLWMLDTAGEWFHDVATQTLYVWMPDGQSPAGQALTGAAMDRGIVANGGTGFSIQNIEVSETRDDAIAIDNASAITIKGVDINRAGNRGLAITRTTNSTLDALLVQDSVANGIWMGDFRYPAPGPSANVNLTNSTVRRAGQGYDAHSAVMLGDGGLVSGNTIESSSNIGIFAWKNSTIQQNVVRDSCTAFDDCGAIYAISRGEYNRADGYPLNLVIAQNLVLGASGSPDGRAEPASSTKGIYLDDFSRLVKVQDNFVTNTDVGYMLHYARNNELTGNLAYGNRVAQWWMQENAPMAFNCTGLTPCDANHYLVGNVISGNAFAQSGAAPAVWMNTDFDSTSLFGQFSGNAYASTTPGMLFKTQRPGQPRPINQGLALWQARSGQDSQSTIDASAPINTKVVGAPDLITNGRFDVNTQGWATHMGVMAVDSNSANCTAAPCMTIKPSVSATPRSNGQKLFLLYTSQAFSVLAGKRYQLSFDIKSEQSSDTAFAVLRDNATGYSEVSGRSSFDLSTNWQHVVRVLAATRNVGGTARLDFEFVGKGPVSIDNVKIVEVQTTAATTPIMAVYNADIAPQAVSCPHSDATACSQLIDLKTHQSVSFPLTLAPRSARILVWANNPWRDGDEDGVADSVDACPSTPPDQGADDRGCALGQ